MIRKRFCLSHTKNKQSQNCLSTTHSNLPILPILPNLPNLSHPPTKIFKKNCASRSEKRSLYYLYSG